MYRSTDTQKVQPQITNSEFKQICLQAADDTSLTIFSFFKSYVKNSNYNGLNQYSTELSELLQLTTAEPFDSGRFFDVLERFNQSRRSLLLNEILVKLIVYLCHGDENRARIFRAAPTMSRQYYDDVMSLGDNNLKSVSSVLNLFESYALDEDAYKNRYDAILTCENESADVMFLSNTMSSATPESQNLFLKMLANVKSDDGYKEFLSAIKIANAIHIQLGMLKVKEQDQDLTKYAILQRKIENRIKAKNGLTKICQSESETSVNLAIKLLFGISPNQAISTNEEKYSRADKLEALLCLASKPKRKNDDNNLVEEYNNFLLACKILKLMNAAFPEASRSGNDFIERCLTSNLNSFEALVFGGMATALTRKNIQDVMLNFICNSFEVKAHNQKRKKTKYSKKIDQLLSQPEYGDVKALVENEEDYKICFEKQTKTEGSQEHSKKSTQPAKSEDSCCTCHNFLSCCLATSFILCCCACIVCTNGECLQCMPTTGAPPSGGGCCGDERDANNNRLTY